MPEQVMIPFVAAKGGLGRTLAILQVARILGERGQRVLVIDLDYTAPGVGAHAGGQDQAGMAEYLRSLARHQSGPALEHVLNRSDRFGYDFVTAGGWPALRDVAFRGITTGVIRIMVSELRRGPWDYVLIDMPPGHLSLLAAGLNRLLYEHATLVCAFFQEGPDHGEFLRRLFASRRTRDLPFVLCVQALAADRATPVFDYSGEAYEAQSFTQLPRLSALERSDSPAWFDPKFLGGHQRLAQAVVDSALYQAHPTPMPPGNYEAAIHALQASNKLPPTILTSKLHTFMQRRLMVISGRHGAGKTALANAAEALGRPVARPRYSDVLAIRQADPDLHWYGVWSQLFEQVLHSPDPPPQRIILDGIDMELAAALGWPATVRALDALAEVAWVLRDDPELPDIKLMLLPGSTRTVAPRLRARHHQLLEWTAAELLELAVRRAALADSSFSSELAIRRDLRLSWRDPLPHDDWTRPVLESVATVLFGPDGLDAWSTILTRNRSVGCELVPGEAAELLMLAFRAAKEEHGRRAAYVPVSLLETTVARYAQQRLERLLDHVSDREAALRVIAGLECAKLRPADDPLTAEMLNWGLLRWIEEPGGDLGIPELVAAAARDYRIGL